MRALPIVILVLLAVLALDVAVLTEGAFRFNSDESIVGVRSELRVSAATPARPLLATPPRWAGMVIVSRPAPHLTRSTEEPPDVASARSCLVVASDDSPSESH